MNLKITFTGKTFEELKIGVRFDGEERFAFILCNRAEHNGNIKLIPQELIFAKPEDYNSVSAGHYQLKNEFVNFVVNKALQQGKDIIQVHSHPFSPGRYSSIDARTELKLMRHISEKIENIYHASMVFAQDLKTLDSWFFDPDTQTLKPTEKVLVIHPDKIEIQSAFKGDDYLQNRDFQDRTIRAFGQDSLKIFKTLDIGIVGASGTGGPLTEQLVRTGIKKITICDPDGIEASNLNRLQGAGLKDIGKNKAVFYKNYLESLIPDLRIEAISSSFYEIQVQEKFALLDVIFSCVDSGAIHSINRLAMANLIPLFMLNSGIEVEQEKTNFIGGQVYSIFPGTKVCINCLGGFENLLHEYLDQESIEREIRQGYVKGANIIQPQVYFLNSMIVALGFWQFLQYALGLQKPALKIYLDALKNKITASTIQDPEGCIICREDSYLGKGNNVSFLIPRKSIELEDLPDATDQNQSSAKKAKTETNDNRGPSSL